jgi:hypothetical protein
LDTAVQCRIDSFRNLTLTRQVRRRVGPERDGELGFGAEVRVTGAHNGFFGSVWRDQFSHPAAGWYRYTSGMSDLTQMLEAAAGGDRKAAADLLPLVYDELRKLAAAKLAAEAPGHSFNPTALVHEAYLRLVGDQQFDGRGHRERVGHSPGPSPLLARFGGAFPSRCPVSRGAGIVSGSWSSLSSLL